MTQGGESLEHDTVLVAKLEQIPFREIWMGFYVNDRRLYGRGFIDLLQLFQADV